MVDEDEGEPYCESNEVDELEMHIAMLQGVMERMQDMIKSGCTVAQLSELINITYKQSKGLHTFDD